MIKKFNNFKINETFTNDIITLCCVDLYDIGFDLVSFSGTVDSLILEKNISSNEKPSDIRTVVLTGNNFELIDTRASITELNSEYKELIEIISDSGSKLKYYSDNTRDEQQITIIVHNSDIIDPFTFETIFKTRITIMYFL